jgi:predicted glycogen debranching enzyme
LRHKESSRRRQLSTPERLAADAYIVKRGNGRTIIAGYPWFGDWGRDAFISLRGLCLANGHLADAQDILVQWSAAVSEGMLPNRFPDHGEAPEYNSVDASL